MRWLRVVLCGLGLAGASASLAQESAEVRHAVAGTGISIAVPAGFRASEDFPGIGRAEDLSSVMVTELDVPLAIAAEAFTEPALQRRGLDFDSTTPMKVDGRDTSLIRATQRIGSMTFRKWFLLLGSETRSVLLTATTPVEFEAEHRDALVHVLESARWGEKNGAAPGTAASAPALSFQVKETTPLRIVRSGDDSIVLSDPEAAKGHVTPVVAVGASQARVDVGDLATFAKARLEETVSIHEIEVDAQGPHALGALDGYQITAHAADTESGRAVRVRQILASDGARYYLVQAIFDVEDDPRLAPAFEAVATSFELRKAGPPSEDRTGIAEKAPAPAASAARKSPGAP